MFFFSKKTAEIYVKGFEEGFRTAVAMLPHISGKVLANVRSEAINEALKRLNGDKLEKQSEF